MPSLSEFRNPKLFQFGTCPSEVRSGSFVMTCPGHRVWEARRRQVSLTWVLGKYMAGFQIDSPLLVPFMVRFRVTLNPKPLFPATSKGCSVRASKRIREAPSARCAIFRPFQKGFVGFCGGYIMPAHKEGVPECSRQNCTLL